MSSNDDGDDNKTSCDQPNADVPCFSSTWLIEFDGSGLPALTGRSEGRPA